MRRHGWKPALLAAVAGTLAAGVVLLFDRDTGLLPLLDARQQVRDAEAGVQATGAERRRLLRRVEALRSDPFAVEAEARRKLGMLREGERVIRWRDGPPAAD